MFKTLLHRSCIFYPVDAKSRVIIGWPVYCQMRHNVPILVHGSSYSIIHILGLCTR